MGTRFARSNYHRAISVVGELYCHIVRGTVHELVEVEIVTSRALLKSHL